VPDGGERGGRAEIKIQERDGEQHDNPPVGEKIFFHSHPIGNMLKIIDFIGDFEFHDSKKRLIPSHSTKKRQKHPIFEGFVEFLWDDYDFFS
jgi:hypothetical protein